MNDQQIIDDIEHHRAQFYKIFLNELGKPLPKKFEKLFELAFSRGFSEGVAFGIKVNFEGEK